MKSKFIRSWMPKDLSISTTLPANRQLAQEVRARVTPQAPSGVCHLVPGARESAAQPCSLPSWPPFPSWPPLLALPPSSSLPPCPPSVAHPGWCAGSLAPCCPPARSRTTTPCRAGSTCLRHHPTHTKRPLSTHRHGHSQNSRVSATLPPASPGFRPAGRPGFPPSPPLTCRGAPGPAGALVGRGLAHGRDDERLHARARVVAVLLVEPRVNHVPAHVAHAHAHPSKGSAHITCMCRAPLD